MFEAKAPHRTGQNDEVHRRTITLCRQLTGNDLIGDALGTAFEHETLHPVRACQVFERSNRNGDRERARLSPTPDDACLDPFRRGSLKDNLVNEATQQGLFLRLREEALPPQRREVLTNGLERRLKLLAQWDQRARGLLGVGDGFFSSLERGKGIVPPVLKGCGNETIVRVNAQELPLGKLSFILETLQVLMMGMRHLIDGLLLGGNSAAVDIQLDGGECLEERFHDGRVDGIPGNMLADGHTIFLAQKVAEIARSPFVLHDQLVSTLATVHHPMEQSGSWTRHPTGFVPVVFSVVVQEHVLNALKHLPGNVGWVHIVDPKFPFLHRKANLSGTRRGRIFSNRARSPVDKGASVRRVFEDLQDGCPCWFLPDEVSETIPSRDTQILGVEETQDLAGRSQAQKRGKDQVEAVLDLLMGILVDALKGITDQPHRKREHEFTSLGFVEQASRHACSNGMQFQLRELSFQSQKQATVR